MSIDRREFIPVIRNAYVIRNPERRDGARGKRHNRSGLFTRIIFAVNILIRSLGAAEKGGGSGCAAPPAASATFAFPCC
ncbi:hypothetical protein [Klebsiella pneumoniae IS43]|uniref:Uncharacterized protein n=1 Tax=Klebsiella pneumoniae IS43 TaxID=1432552 RepID=W1DKS2_KLEPN|nr:hypothetical protein [Klebsiella pneumoniae IS43]